MRICHRCGGFRTNPSEVVASINMGGRDIDIVGYWDTDTAEGFYDSYDVFHDGECLNLGNPIYEIPETEIELRKFLKQFVH